MRIPSLKALSPTPVRLLPVVGVAAMLMAAAFAAPHLAGASVNLALGANENGATLAADADAGGATAAAAAAAGAGGAQAEAALDPGLADDSRPPRDPRDFRIAISPAHQRIPAGGSGHYAVNLSNPTNDSLLVRLDVSNVTRGWSAALGSSEVEVPARGGASTRLTLSPREGAPSRAVVTVTGTIDGDRATSRSASASAEIANASIPPPPPPPCGCTTLDLSPDRQKAPPGGRVAFNLTLAHGGNGSETYALTAYGDGLSPRVTPESLTLQPGEVGRATVFVTVPEDAVPGEHALRAYARDSRGRDVAKDSAIVDVTNASRPTPISGVDMWIDPREQDVAPGGGALYRVTLASRSGASQTVDLRVTNLTRGWSAALDPDAVTLAPFESRAVLLKLAAPAHAVDGDRGFAGVAATIRDAPHGPHAWASAFASVREAARFGVDVEAYALDAEALPGENLSYVAVVRNTGNAAATIDLGLLVEPAYPGYLGASSVTLAPGNATRVPLGAHVPRDAEPGTTVVLTVFAKVREDRGATADAARASGLVLAPHRHGVRAAFTDGDHRYAAPGESTRFTLRVENGDHAHALYLRAENLPNGWAFEASPAAFSLAAGEARTVDVRVTVPRCEDLSERAIDFALYTGPSTLRANDTAPHPHGGHEPVARLTATVQVVHSAGILGAVRDCATSSP